MLGFFLCSCFDCLKIGLDVWVFLFVSPYTSLETACSLLLAVGDISKIAEEAFSVSYYLFKMKTTQNTVLSNTERSDLRLRE